MLQLPRYQLESQSTLAFLAAKSAGGRQEGSARPDNRAQFDTR